MPNYYDPYKEEEPAVGSAETDLTATGDAHAPARPRQQEPARRKPRKPASAAGPRAASVSRQTRPDALREKITDGRLRMICGVLLIIAAAYLLVAAVSTFLSAGADQAAVQYNSVGQIVSSGTKVDNAAGPAGAVLGRIMLTDTLGVGSFVIIYWLAMIGLKLVGKVSTNFWSLTFKCLILAITLSIVAGLVTYTAASPMRYGGDHGYYVNDWLIKTASPVGAICVSIALIACVAIIFINEITAAIAAYRRKVAAIKAARQASQEKERNERRMVSEQMGGAVHDAQPEAEPETDMPDEEPIDLTAAIETDEADEADTIDAEFNDPAAADNDEPATDEFEITAHEIEEADTVVSDTYDPTAELSHYRFPSIDLLEDRAGSKVTVDTAEQETNKQRIIEALAQFNIEISSIKATVGPTITLFEVVPAAGQRIAAIKRVEEDLALALKALGIRIIAPIPGKGTIGIEVPNNDPQVVSMRSIINSKKFQECHYELPMALGATISNEVFIADLAKMPHLLVAGATGQGKSVGLNAIITSLLYKKHPAELKFVLVDPKMVEFSLYRSLENHYLAKLPDEEDAVITDPAKVVATLNSLCVEMDNRYTLLSNAGCRGVKEYNAKFTAKRLNPEKGHRFMPYIVVIVDEFADLIMTAGKEVEAPICRLAQKARAVGIHVIIATQRPSTNVITGLIKANFPGRIAFRVAQSVDSKTILDRSGAHQLVGRGDMFFSTNGNLERVQCAFIDTPEVEAICESISEQPGFGHAYELPEFVPDAGGLGGAAFGGQPGSDFNRDPLFEEAARFLVSAGDTASTSSLQRRYSIGYNRAGKLMDQLEAAGVVAPASGSKPRTILVDPMTLESMLSL